MALSLPVSLSLPTHPNRALQNNPKTTAQTKWSKEGPWPKDGEIGGLTTRKPFLSTFTVRTRTEGSGHASLAF